MRLAWQREVYGTWRTNATDQALVWGALVLALVPLWFFKYTPAAHWPDHVAVSSVLYRLLHHDSGVEQLYALNAASGGWSLLYRVLTPCVGWFGPFVGAKIVLSAIAVLCVLAIHLCCAALDRPRILGIGGIFIFYGAVFFWGFGTTLAGVPWVILLLWALLRCMPGRRTGWVATASLFAVLAAMADPMLAVATVAAIVSFWCVDPKRHAAAALLIVTPALAPVAPSLWQVLHGAGLGIFSSVRLESPVSAWDHLRVYLASFDRGLGRAGHHGLVLLLLALMLVPNPRVARGPQRMVLMFALLCTGLFLVVPPSLSAGGDGRWYNMRCLTCAEVGLLLACVEPGSLGLRRALRYGVGMCFVLFLTGLVTLWQGFEATARPLDELMSMVPVQSTMAVRGPAQGVMQEHRPPLASRLSAYCLARGLAIESGGAEDTRGPIRPRHPPESASGPLAMGDFDYLLVQGHPAQERNFGIPGGHLIKEAGIWQLYQRL